MSVTLDEMARTFLEVMPNHIKIDVDGIEDQVVLGAEALLQSTQLKSILLELNFSLPSNKQIYGILLSLGFKTQFDFRKDGNYPIVEIPILGILYSLESKWPSFVIPRHSC